MKKMMDKRETQRALDEVLRTLTWLDADDDADGKLDRFFETADGDMILQLVAAGGTSHSDGPALRARYQKRRQGPETTIVSPTRAGIGAKRSTSNRSVGVSPSNQPHTRSTMRTQPSMRPALAKTSKRISWCKPLLWLMPWLLIAAACFGIAAFNNDGGTPAASTSPAVVDTSHLTSQKLPAKNTGKYLTCDIRDLPVAVWILADNPETEGNLGFDYSELDPSELRILRLRMEKPDGGLLHIDRLEFTKWLESQQITAGSSMPLHYEELGISGPAKVLEILPCPTIPPRPSPGHCLVTSKFAHEASNVLDLKIEGLDAPIGVTANHPIWSEDRLDYVPAVDLRPGERLLNADNSITRVSNILARSTTEPVFNLEVDGEHVYFVSSSGILVHNSCAVEMHHTIPRGIQKRLRKAGNSIADDADIIGRRGLPNRKAVPRTNHRQIHSGKGYTGKGKTGIGGGHYNNAFHRMIESRGGYDKVSKKQVLEIRDFLVRWFDL